MVPVVPHWPTAFTTWLFNGSRRLRPPGGGGPGGVGGEGGDGPGGVGGEGGEGGGEGGAGGPLHGSVHPPATFCFSSDQHLPHASHGNEGGQADKDALTHVRKATGRKMNID